MAGLFDELKRRGVIRIGLAYLAITWLMLQVIDVLSGTVALPDWLPLFALLALGAGLPIALVLAWSFEVTAAGIQTTEAANRAGVPPTLSGRKLDFVIIGALTMVVALLVLKDRIVPSIEIPIVGDYRRVTESPVIFPPFGSPYPLVPGDSRLYFSDFATGRMTVKQVSMSGGDLQPFVTPNNNPNELFRPTASLPDGTGVLMLSFEPDVLEGKIWKFPFVGGMPRFLGYGFDAAPSPDGSRIAFVRPGVKLLVADADMLNEQVVAEIDAQRAHWIAWSPDGGTLRYTVGSSPRAIWEVSADGGTPRRAVPRFEGIEHCCGAWTPDGQYFVFQAEKGLHTQLFAVRGSRDDPVPITIGPLDFRRPTIAADGRSIFAIGWQLRGEAVAVDPVTGRMSSLVATEDLSAEWIHYAANADLMTWVSYPEGNVWVGRSDGSERLQLIFDDFKGLAPMLSPDGRWVLVNIFRDGTLAVFLVPSDGGTPRQISKKGVYTYAGGWSPDSRQFILREGLKDVVQVVDIETEERTILPDAAGLRNPMWSPGGGQLFGYGDDWLSIYDIDSGKTRSLLSERPLEQAYWGNDDSTIYIVDWHTRGGDRGVYAVDTATGEETPVFTFGNRRIAWGQWGMWIGVTADGEPMFLRDLSIHHIYELDWLPQAEPMAAE